MDPNIIKGIFVQDMSRFANFEEYLKNDKYIQELLDRKSLFGEFFNPDRDLTQAIQIQIINLAYRITNIYLIKNKLYIDIEYLNNYRSRWLQDIYNNYSENIQFVPRVIGSLSATGTIDDYRLITVDVNFKSPSYIIEENCNDKKV